MGLRQLLDVVDAGADGIAIGLRRADLEHVQDDLRIFWDLRCALCPQSRSRALGVAKQVADDTCRGLEADDHWPTEVEQVTHETIMFGSGVQHNQPAALAHPGNLDQYIVAQLRDVDGYQNRVGRRKLDIGHGRASPKC